MTLCCHVTVFITSSPRPFQISLFLSGMSRGWMKDCHVGERQQRLSWMQLFSGSFHGRPLLSVSLWSLPPADSDLGRFLCSQRPWQAPQVHGKFRTPHSWQKEVFRISHHPSVSQLAAVLLVSDRRPAEPSQGQGRLALPGQARSNARPQFCHHPTCLAT